jgi:hypothetical protein
MTERVKLVTGPVRQVFTVHGKPVTSLEEFEDGGKYICCGAESVNKAQSISFLLTHKIQCLLF